MARLILLLFVAFAVANWLAPSLSFFFGQILNLDAINIFAALPRVANRSPEGLLEVAFWTLMIWLAFSYGYIPFGFIRPRAARFSDTKFLRYFQLGVFESLLVVTTLILTLFFAVSRLENQTIKTDEQLAIQAEMGAVDEILERIKRDFTEKYRDNLSAALGTNEFLTLRSRLRSSLSYAQFGCQATLASAAKNRGLDRSAAGRKGVANCFIAVEIGSYRQAIPPLTERTFQALKKLEDLKTPDSRRQEAVMLLLTEFLIFYLVGSLVAYAILRAIVGAVLSSNAFLSVIRFLDQSRFGYGGAGRFTGLFEELASRFESGSALFLGRSLFNPFIKIGMKDERHMLTIAGSRGGKGVSVIIPNLLKWNGSAIVIDPKGTNAAVTADCREKKLKQSVYVIDPFGITDSENAAGFDPLDQFSAQDPDVREKIILVADALVMREGNAKDPHWDDVSRQILAGYIAHLMTDDAYKGRRKLPELRNMLRKAGKDRTNLLTDMLLNEAAGGLTIDVASRIMNMGDSSELRSVMSSIEKHTEWLSSPAMVKALSGTSVKFSTLKREKTTIYLVIPPQYLQAHARFVRLFINLAIRGFVDGGKSNIPTLMIMDEFLSLGHMSEVENAMSWTAGYNLFLWPFVQDFGTLKELYGSKVNAFLTNSRAVQVFAIDDEDTNRFVSDRVGKRPLQSRLDITRSNETLPLREPSEVSMDISAESGRQYVLQSGKPTMLLERVPYFKSHFFRGYGVDPDHPKGVDWWRKQF